MAATRSSTLLRHLSSTARSVNLQSIPKRHPSPFASSNIIRSSHYSRIRISQSTIRTFATEPPKTPSSPTTSKTGATTEPVVAPGAPPRPKGGNNRLKVWPFVFIFLTGAAGFALIVEQRKDQPNKMPVIGGQKKEDEKPSNQDLPQLRSDGPCFNNKDVKVIFVLGGPGVGKGTQCANLVRDYNFIHLSAGDLLREEQSRSGTQYGDLIKEYIKNGQIVPMEVTIVLLENAMRSNLEKDSHAKFLIDGFPRQMDQAVKFEETVVESVFTLFFDCDEDTMTKRLLERGKTSGRSDDNMESILKRFRTFKETSMPVVNYFEKQGKVVKIDASKNVDGVYADVKTHIKDRLE